MSVNTLTFPFIPVSAVHVRSRSARNKASAVPDSARFEKFGNFLRKFNYFRWVAAIRSVAKYVNRMSAQPYTFGRDRPQTPIKRASAAVADHRQVAFFATPREIFLGFFGGASHKFAIRIAAIQQQKNLYSLSRNKMPRSNVMNPVYLLICRAIERNTEFCKNGDGVFSPSLSSFRDITLQCGIT